MPHLSMGYDNNVIKAGGNGADPPAVKCISRHTSAYSRYTEQHRVPWRSYFETVTKAMTASHARGSYGTNIRRLPTVQLSKRTDTLGSSGGVSKHPTSARPKQRPPSPLVLRSETARLLTLVPVAKRHFPSKNLSERNSFL